MENKGVFSSRVLTFLKIMCEHDNVIDVSQQAIGMFSDELQIDSVVLSILVPDTKFTPSGQEKKLLLYDKKERTYENWERPVGVDCYIKSYTTGENGRVFIEIYGSCSDGTWSSVTRADIESFAELIFIYSARTRLVNQLKKNSMTDTLTGIYNTEGYIYYGNQLIKKGNIGDYVAFFWNIQNMKVFNQQYNAEFGDNIIRKIAKTVKSMLDEDELVARPGGDNFVALVKREKMDRMITLLKCVDICLSFQGELVNIFITSNGGVYPVEAGVTSMSDIMSKSSVAYRVAKDVVKQNIVVYSAETEKQLMLGKEILYKFNKGLADEEFLVYYQPKIDTNTMEMVGAEALVRWLQDDKIVIPGDFIPVLERDEQVCKLDFYMLDKVCCNLREWLDAGVDPVPISVNFSRRHLSNYYLVEDIMLILQKYNIPTELVEIEITESVDEKECSRLREVLVQLHRNNFAVAVDDFGKGASSLNMLCSMPVDILKIDRSFIVRAVESTKDRIVLTNIIQLSKELGIKVLMEGVENHDQMELLRQLDCFLIQGYLFDKPLSKDEFDNRLENRHYKLKK